MADPKKGRGGGALIWNFQICAIRAEFCIKKVKFWAKGDGRAPPSKSTTECQGYFKLMISLYIIAYLGKGTYWQLNTSCWLYFGVMFQI